MDIIAGRAGTFLYPLERANKIVFSDVQIKQKQFQSMTKFESFWICSMETKLLTVYLPGLPGLFTYQSIALLIIPMIRKP